MKTTPLTPLATKVIGGSTALRNIRKKRQIRSITNEVIRHLFITPAKEVVTTLSPAQLGNIISHNNALRFDDPNTESAALFLSPNDSGYHLLQKIAVASLISEVTRLIQEDQPTRKKKWLPIDLIGLEASANFSRRKRLANFIAGW